MTQVYKSIKSNQQRAEHPNKRVSPIVLILPSLDGIIWGSYYSGSEYPRAASWGLRNALETSEVGSIFGVT